MSVFIAPLTKEIEGVFLNFETFEGIRHEKAEIFILICR